MRPFPTNSRWAKISTLVNLVSGFIRLNRQLSNRCEQLLRKFLPHFVDPRAEFGATLAQVSKPHFKVLEIGGTSRPFYDQTEFRRYDGLDIDDCEEASQLYSSYFCQSVTEAFPEQDYDLVFSQFLMEHVNDVRRAFQNVGAALRDDGVSVHLIPCGFHPYAIPTRLMGNRLQKLLIAWLRPKSVNTTGYPVFFDHCSCYGFKKIAREQKWQDTSITYFFRGEDYFKFFFPLFLAMACFNAVCHLLRLNLFASSALLTYRIPAASACRADE